MLSPFLRYGLGSHPTSSSSSELSCLSSSNCRNSGAGLTHAVQDGVDLENAQWCEVVWATGVCLTWQAGLCCSVRPQTQWLRWEKVIVWVLAHPCRVLQALPGVAFRVRLLQGFIRSPNWNSHSQRVPVGEVCAEIQGWGKEAIDTSGLTSLVVCVSFLIKRFLLTSLVAKSPSFSYPKSLWLYREWISKSSKEGAGHLKEELPLIQLLGWNVTPSLWSDVKADKDRKLLPCSEHEKGLIVFTSQVLDHQHYGKNHSGSTGFHQR